MDKLARCAAMLCCMRCAALPVGAASEIRNSGLSVSKATRMRTTVVVLPVPGPPAITMKRREGVASSRSRMRAARSRSYS